MRLLIPIIMLGMSAIAVGQEVAKTLHDLTGSSTSFQLVGMGIDVAGIDDVDGDGILDVMIAGRGVDSNQQNYAVVQTRSGSTTSILMEWIFAVPAQYSNYQVLVDVKGLGDVNGDGAADFIVGLPQDQTNGIDAGMVWVKSGLDGSTIFQLAGGAAHAEFGRSVDAAGDVNGDGFDDFIVGAPSESGAAAEGGVVRVYSGLDGTIIHTFSGTVPNGHFGFSVASIPDIDFDQRDEIVIGAPGDSAATLGHVMVYSGMTGAVLRSIPSPANALRFGRFVDSAGDFNSDGHCDVLVGPLLRIYSVADGEELLNFDGSPFGITFVGSAANASDVNGDGHDDYVLGGGGPGYNHNGSFVISGKDQELLFSIPADTGANFSGLLSNAIGGFAVAAAGDVDTDGYADFYVATPGRARVRLFRGGESTRVGQTIEANYLYSNSSNLAGDVNNDGVHDIVVGGTVFSGADQSTLLAINGLPLQSLGDVNNDGYDDLVGRVFVGYGSSGAVISGFDGSVQSSFMGIHPDDVFGSSIAVVSDVNQDGINDFIFGAPENLGNAIFGYARVFSGADGSVIHTFHGVEAGSEFGSLVRDAGDIDGDGCHDFLILSRNETSPTGLKEVLRIFSGTSGLLLRSQTIAPWGSWSDADGVGDVNQDGFDDYMASRTSSPVSVPSGSGAVTVYSGFDGSVIHTIPGREQWDYFGQQVAGIGDFNGDGFPDIAVGAPQIDFNSGENSLFGSVYVFSGKDGSELHRIIGRENTSALGIIVSRGGDLNGDGFSDLIVGARGTEDELFLPIDGYVRTILAPTLPILNYDSEEGETDLLLLWNPDSGNIQDTDGTLICQGASPGGLGLYAVSLARADIPLAFGFPLLVASDATNLIATGTFSFDQFGKITAPGLSRQSPAIAGSKLHIQFFETFPNFSASNAIRMEITF